MSSVNWYISEELSLINGVIYQLLNSIWTMMSWDQDDLLISFSLSFYVILGVVIVMFLSQMKE